VPTPLRKIRVMLSSRNTDTIPDGARAVRLLEVRRAIARELAAEKLCGEALLEVWINEEAGAQNASNDAWDTCMQEVDRADVVVVIYNGNAGWTREAGGVGICHAELQHALTRAPAKVRLIALEFASDGKRGLRAPVEVAEANATNRVLARDLAAWNLFHGRATDRDTLRTVVRRAVVEAVSDLVRTGSREGRRGRYHLGTPLDWSRLDYATRKTALEAAVREHLDATGGGAPDAGGSTLSLGGGTVLVLVHGVPSSFGVPEARELVGRPHLADHRTAVTRAGSNLAGPLHVVACHKGCTESQVVRFMGHPDLFLVQPPFGWFVADETSFAQLVFLTNCRDSTSTRTACQRMLEWVEQSGEAPRLVARAASRARFLKFLAAELGDVGAVRRRRRDGR
jgi:hypothetical protein